MTGQATFYNCLSSQCSDNQYIDTYKHLYGASVCLGVCPGVFLGVLVSVCLYVSPFSQPCFNTETVTLVSYPGMANHQSLLNLNLIRPWCMVNRLICLISKLLKAQYLENGTR